MINEKEIFLIKFFFVLSFLIVLNISKNTTLEKFVFFWNHKIKFFRSQIFKTSIGSKLSKEFRFMKIIRPQLSFWKRLFSDIHIHKNWNFWNLQIFALLAAFFQKYYFFFYLQVPFFLSELSSPLPLPFKVICILAGGGGVRFLYPPESQYVCK